MESCNAVKADKRKRQKSKDTESKSEACAKSNAPKNDDGTLKMEPFFKYLPQGKYKEELAYYCDMEVLFGKLKYSSSILGDNEIHSHGGLKEDKIAFLGKPLNLVWGNDDEEHHLSVYRIIVLLMFVRYVMQQHRSCEEVPSPTIVMTDIHGQLPDLLEWFYKMGGLEQSGYNFVCTGDMVDRGDFQLEVACLFFYYKLRYPSRAFLLRGNHEDFDLHENYGFQEHCFKRFTKYAKEPAHIAMAQNMWYLFIHVFDYLPSVAIVEKKVLCVHGGISPLMTFCTECKTAGKKVSLLDICHEHSKPKRLRDLIQMINRHVRTPVQIGKNCVDVGEIHKVYNITDPADYTCLLSDLLWSDPTPDNTLSKKGAASQPTGWEENKPRRSSFLYGKDVVQKFMQLYPLSVIVRGHEAKHTGFEWACAKQCITVFSAPNYLNGNSAAIAIITTVPHGNKRRLRLDPIVMNQNSTDDN